MSVSPLSGKGVWIRRIVACEQGDLAAIVTRAQAAGFTHVILKIADGAEAYNADPLTGEAVELTRRLRDAGLSVWGWHYLYGDKPRFKGRFEKDYHRLEADQAVQTVSTLREAGLQGYVMSAEGEYERAPGRADQATEFVATLRAGLGDFPLALASWKFPNSHKRFPWAQFRQHSVLDLPQVFWLGRHREAPAQLEKSFQQYAALKPRLPYLPVAPALFENGWRPSPTDLDQFAARAMALGLPGFNLWAWDYLGLRGDEATGNPERLDFQEHWEVVAKTEWRETKADEGRQMEDASLSLPSIRATRMPDAWAAELADLTADETDLELTAFGIESEPVVEETQALELTEDLSAISFGLSSSPAPESPFTPEPLPAAESDEIRTRVQEAADRYTDSFRDLRTAHRDQLIALGAQSLLGQAVTDENLSITLAGQVVGEARVGSPTADDQAPTPSPVVELLPDELTAGLESLTASDDDGDDLPDWLREAEAAELTEDDAEPARPFTPEAVALDLMPDELVAELESLTASEDDGDDLPDWLREAESVELTDDDAEPARPFAPEAIALDLMPDELVTELESLKADEGDEAEADLPEWLRDFDIESIEARLSEEDAEPARPFTPEAEAVTFTPLPEALAAELESLAESDDDDADADLPEWLRDFQAEMGEVAEEDSEPVRPFAPEPEAGVGTLIAPPVATATTSPTISKLFSALSHGRLEEAFRLYAPAFTLVHGQHMARDRAGLRRFYLWLLPGLQRETLVVHSLHVNRLTVQAHWSCQSQPGRMIEGVDTFHLNRRNQIVYHHTTLNFDPDSS